MRQFTWTSIAFAAALGGCSLYPIPDDVSAYSTEYIVRDGRCEVRDAILAHLIDRKIIHEPPTIEQVENAIKVVKTKEEKFPKALNYDEKNFLRLLRVAIVYSYDFNIVETNKAGADAGFRLPGLTNVLDVSGTAALDLSRQGSRVFGTEDDWEDLITNDRLCNAIAPRPGNIVYPLTGSIGVGRVVKTFLDIEQQGGAKDNFVDTLTFTTLASGAANASFRLDPVPNQFRPVAASAAVGASRLDVHKLTVSLAFPQAPRGGISGVIRSDGDLNAPEDVPFERPPAWRARYNLCVQDARTREALFKQLRLNDPLIYCITYADRFAPSFENRAIAVTMPRLIPGKPRTAGKPATPPKIVPETFLRQVRPNEGPGLLER